MFESARLLAAKPKTKPPAVNAVVETNCRLETLVINKSTTSSVSVLKRLCVLRLSVTCVLAFAGCAQLGVLTFYTNTD